MPFHNLAYASERREHRDEVHFRATARGTGNRDVPLVIVNISPNGLMARCDLPLETGARLSFTLPDRTAILAEVRWALGGRIGCEFETVIPPARYQALLPALRN